MQKLKSIIRFIMSIVHEHQQRIFRRNWIQASRTIHNAKLGKHMIVKGKVVGTVDLQDINKKIAYNSTAVITEFEINKSKSLQEAIHRGWIEIIEDRGALLRAVVVNGQQQTQIAQIPSQGIDEAKMFEIAAHVAKTTAAEMMKNNVSQDDLVKTLAKQMAKEMMAELQLNPGQSQTKQEEKVTIENIVLDEQKPENVFINVEADGMKANTTNIGTEKEETVNISSSLEKMKRFRRKVGSNEQ
jgi:hypothetical protein